MNANRLINMILRIGLRKVMNAGAKKAGGSQGQKQMRNLNKAARLARRAGRF